MPRMSLPVLQALRQSSPLPFPRNPTFIIGAVRGFPRHPRTGTRSVAIEKSALEPSMRCTREGTKRSNVARAAIFRPDMAHSGTVCCRAWVVRATARARLFVRHGARRPRDARTPTCIHGGCFKTRATLKHLLYSGKMDHSNLFSIVK